MTVGNGGGGEGDNDKIRVAVRVRPFNKREVELKTKCVVSMQQQQITLSHPNDEKGPKPFTFDHCFNSTNLNDASFSSQEDVYAKVGSGVVQNAFDGYNACIFAYGQTGSGKSYTMMGSSDSPGIIPRLCTSLFDKIRTESNESTSFKVEVSYMEIYNEKVRDLLDPKNGMKRPLKVREHAILGPMVEGLAVLAVSSYEQIVRLIDDGNKCRTVAATNMNAESSRSHAVFTIRLTQTVSNLSSNDALTGEKVSKISLVDLAGSERAQKSGAVGKRLEEGANINKSLTTLGMVISALAERSAKKEKFIPYRDSILTWLLKDNLGGNSKTVMIATVSPAGDNYEETLSTLRYADRAKRIVNHAVVNEDPNAKIIRELREEVETLRMQINQSQEKQNEADELRERLAESERLVEMMNKSWEERLKETDVLYREHQRDLAEIGISVAESGIKVEKDRFYLVNLNADPSLNELLVYYINQQAIIGSAERFKDPLGGGERKVDFLLQGLGVHPRHALLEVVMEPPMVLSAEETEEERREMRPHLYISALSPGARICVNGRQLEFGGPKVLLRNGYRLLIGNNHFFRVNCPKEETVTANATSLNNTSMTTSFAVNAIDGVSDLAAETTTATTLTRDFSSTFFDYDTAWLEANAGDCGGGSRAAAGTSSQQSHAVANGAVTSDGVGNVSDLSSAMDYYIEQMTIRHAEDKQAALERQYEEFERYIQGLTQNLQTPSTPMSAAGSAFGAAIAGTPSGQLPSVSFPTGTTRSADKSKFFKWAQKREDLFKQSLRQLKTEIVKANALAREANLITEELWSAHKSRRRGLAHYDVTLQIPATNLRPSKIKAGNSVCEPVIVVKWQGTSGYQLWSVEHLENKLIDLRELYNEQRTTRRFSSGRSERYDNSGSSNGSSDGSGGCEASTTKTTSSGGDPATTSSSSSSSGVDCCREEEDYDAAVDEVDDSGDVESAIMNDGQSSPALLGLMSCPESPSATETRLFGRGSGLLESQEKHSLIGVANVFLEVLFHRLKLDYYVPIISQQGEVCGKLHVEVYRLPEPSALKESSLSSTGLESEDAMDEPSFGMEDDVYGGRVSSNFYHRSDKEHLYGRTIQCRVRIKKAINLPQSLSHFVFCQYSFFNTADMLVVAPKLDPPVIDAIERQLPRPIPRRNSLWRLSGSREQPPELPATVDKQPAATSSTTFYFEHEMDFSVMVNEEFLEYVEEDALSIEVWGHRSGGNEEYELDILASNASVQDAKQKAQLPKPPSSSGLAGLFSFASSKLPTPNGFYETWTNAASISGGEEEEDTTDTAICRNGHLRNNARLDVVQDVARRKQKSLEERWSEVTRRVELWVEIMEMNDDGEYVNVNVVPHECDFRRQAGVVATGGIYQLKQGQQRRLKVHLRTVDDGCMNGLPLNFADILSVAVGSVVVKEDDMLITSHVAGSCYASTSNLLSYDEWGRPSATAALTFDNYANRMDSYQEEDLERIRDQWCKALATRHSYLEKQIHEISAKGSAKSDTDAERERALINQWVELTEERNAVFLPSSNSHIPGAPADWQPPQGIEYHVPVVFLNLDAEELVANDVLAGPAVRRRNRFDDDYDEEDEDDEDFGVAGMVGDDGSRRVAGLNTMLPFETFEEMLPLPMLEKCQRSEMSATCSWDSSTHGMVALNRAAPRLNELVFLCVNVIARLAPPFSMDVVLRKRVCVNVYRRSGGSGGGLAERLMRRIVGGNGGGSSSASLSGTGVFYDIVAHVPKASMDVEDRATLAMMAVRHAVSSDGESIGNELNVDGGFLTSTVSNGACDLLKAAAVNNDPVLYDSASDEDLCGGVGANTDGPNGWSYIEAYTKSIQAVEWMLKLDRLRQESAMYSVLNRQEKKPTSRQVVSGMAPPSTLFRMKRAISMPSNMALPPIPPRSSMGVARLRQSNHSRAAVPPAMNEAEELDGGGDESPIAHRAVASLVPTALTPIGESASNGHLMMMDVSTSASSGYASMASSITNQNADSVNGFNRLYGIDEELPLGGAVGGAPFRQSLTVPETLNRLTDGCGGSGLTRGCDEIQEVLEDECVIGGGTVKYSASASETSLLTVSPSTSNNDSSDEAVATNSNNNNDSRRHEDGEGEAEEEWLCRTNRLFFDGKLARVEATMVPQKKPNTTKKRNNPESADDHGEMDGEEEEDEEEEMVLLVERENPMMELASTASVISSATSTNNNHKDGVFAALLLSGSGVATGGSGGDSYCGVEATTKRRTGGSASHPVALLSQQSQTTTKPHFFANTMASVAAAAASKQSMTENQRAITRNE